MASYCLYQTCWLCNGEGTLRKNTGTGNNPVWEESDCPICLTTGKLLWGEYEQSFTDVIDNIFDKCNDIMNKCNDIFEKVNV